MVYAGLSTKKTKIALQQDLKLVVESLLSGNPLPEELFSEILNLVQESNPHTPFDWIPNLRALALLALSIEKNPSLRSAQKNILEYIKKIKILRSSPQIQLIDAYEELIKSCFFSTPYHPQVVPKTVFGGSAPFEPEGYLSWGQIPMGRYHPELGVIWLLLGRKTGQMGFLNGALHIGSWELSFSKFNGEPFPGLFSCEADYDEAEHSAWRILLFSLLYQHTHDKKYDLPQLRDRENWEMLRVQNPFAEYLRSMIFSEEFPRSVSAEAPAHLLVSDVGLNLHRRCDPELSLFFTTSGGRTGLGGFSYKSIEVVTYAPHLYPLDEAEGFGVSTLPHLSTLRSQFSNEEECVRCNGTARLNSIPHTEHSQPWNQFREGEYQPAWLDVEQILKGNNRIEVETKIRSFAPLPELAFTFFVKASGVRMDDVEAIPNQLRHFVMEVSTLEIIGEDCSVRLFQHVDNIPLERYSVEVIPLGGNRAFWGSDFLISFRYGRPDLKNRWILELV